MYKKLTGIEERRETEEVLKDCKNQRDDFYNTMQLLRAQKKNHKKYKPDRVYMNLNQYAEVELQMSDAQIERQEREAQRAKEEKESKMFKFGKMKKKAPFFPCVQVKGDIQKPQDTVELHDKYMDGRSKESLIFPNKVKNNTKNWTYQGHRTGYIGSIVGREIDKFDDKLVKYFKDPGRGETTRAFVSEKQPDGTMTREFKKLKWEKATFHGTELLHVKPLIDNTLTPRGQKKAVELDRVMERKKWTHNSHTLNEFKERKKSKY